jgi:hypothetical protein
MKKGGRRAFIYSTVGTVKTNVLFNERIQNHEKKHFVRFARMLDDRFSLLDGWL